MYKNLRRSMKIAFLTLSLLAPVAINSASAQEAGNRQSAARDDDGFDLGWMGLAGLIGLAGLAGLSRDRNRHAVTAESSSNRR